MMTTDKLITLAKLLEELASVLKEFIGEDVPAAPQVEQTAPTLEDVRTVLAEISRNGKTTEMKQLLSQFGASKLSDVKTEDYAALLEAARNA